MKAAIDVGTNTVRLLLGEVGNGHIEPLRYFRRITRLGGGFSPDRGLDPDARERTLDALREAASIVTGAGATTVRAVGTEILRKASDGPDFCEQVRRECGLLLEIIYGEEEARLSATGVRAALDPMPQSCIIMDIGGGSTEFILWDGNGISFARSYPLGVVSLCEDCRSAEEQQRRIDGILEKFRRDIESSGVKSWNRTPLVGTAGTVTTLGALKLGMTQYDWKKINNLVLRASDLNEMLAALEPLPVSARERIPGMEKGRGDLIIPGTKIVLGVLGLLGLDRLTVSDFGLLEGVLLDSCKQH